MKIWMSFIWRHRQAVSLSCVWRKSSHQPLKFLEVSPQLPEKLSHPVYLIRPKLMGNLGFPVLLVVAEKAQVFHFHILEQQWARRNGSKSGTQRNHYSKEILSAASALRPWPGLLLGSFVQLFLHIEPCSVRSCSKVRRTLKDMRLWFICFLRKRWIFTSLILRFS